MKRKHWIILGTTVAVLALLCAGTIGGYLLYKKKMSDGYLASAEEHFAAGNWDNAKSSYAWYISGQPDKTEALRKYAQASEKILSDRPNMLRDAAAAYYQLVLNDPLDKQSVDKLRNIYIRLNAWADVEYLAGLSVIEPGPALKYYRALALSRLNRRDEAINAYRDLINEKTEYAEAYGDLAILLLEQELVREADGVFAQAEQNDPDKPYVLLQQARYGFARNDLDGVDSALDRAAELIPGDPKLLAMQARAAMARLDWTAAMELWEASLAVAPEDEEAHLGLIGTYEHLDLNEAAMAHLESLPDAFLADAPTLQMLSVEILLRLERIEVAEAALAHYAVLYPDNSIIHEYLEALCLLAKGDAFTAAIKLTNTVRTRPDNRQARMYLALACLQSQQRSRARTILEKYQSDFPADAYAAALYEREYGEQQTLQETRRAAQALFGTSDASATTLTSAASAILKHPGQPANEDPATAEARRLLETAIDAEPTEPAAYLVMADLILGLDDLDGAMRLIDQAATNGVEEDSLWLPRACLFILSGEREEGLTLIRTHLPVQDTAIVSEIMRVANILASRGALDDGLAVIEDALARLDASDRRMLELERIGLAARFDRIDVAIAHMRDMEGWSGHPELVLSSLYARKEELVRTLIQPGSTYEPELAKTLVEELARTLPNNTDITLLKARVLLEHSSENSQAAREALEPLVGEGKRNFRALKTMAEIALREGRLSDALSYAEKAAAEAPDDTGARVLLADIQFRMQHYLDATTTLEEALASNPSDKRTMGLLIEAYRSTDRLIQAETLLTRLEEAYEESNESGDKIEVLRGRLLLAKGEELERVENIFRRQYEADPDDFRVVADLARTMSGLNRLDDAEQILTGYTESHGSRADGWVALAQFYSTKGGPSSRADATSAYTRALLADNNYPPALRGLVSLELEAKNTTKAIGLCDRYLAQKPYDPSVLYLKASLLAQRVETTEYAREVVSSAIDIIERAEYLYLRAIVNLNTKNYADVIPDLDRIARIQGQITAGIDLSYAEAYWATGQKESAKQHYISAVKKVNPGNLGDKERLRRIGDLIDAEGDDA